MWGTSCVTWAELMNWAEIHHILHHRYAADGPLPRRWHEVRQPANGPESHHGRDHQPLPTRNGEAALQSPRSRGEKTAPAGPNGRTQVRLLAERLLPPKISTDVLYAAPGAGQGIRARIP